MSVIFRLRLVCKGKLSKMGLSLVINFMSMDYHSLTCKRINHNTVAIILFRRGFKLIEFTFGNQVWTSSIKLERIKTIYKNIEKLETY